MEAGIMALVKNLVTASKTDTLFRDIYLRRARELFSPGFPRSAYRTIKVNKADIDTVLRQSDSAVERGDWTKARDLAVRMKGLRQSVDEHADEFELGREVYETAEVEFDPFSPGLSSVAPGLNQEEARNRGVAALTALEHDDGVMRVFYAQRCRFTVGVTAEKVANGQEIGRPAPRLFKQDALKALSQGNVEEFDRLLAGLTGHSTSTQRSALIGGSGVADHDHAALAMPFPAGTTERARKRGLATIRLQPGEKVAEYWGQLVTRNATIEPQFTQDGGMQLTGLPDPDGVTDATSAQKIQLKETLSLFLIHHFVNSAGARYLPHMVAEEILAEDFPEGNPDHPDTGLLALLGLPRRGALSRMTIEEALLERGYDIINNELGLDPYEFRLVCIPFDIYIRLGQSQGWGAQKYWTHFDGYQVVKGGYVRALVGGDVRYGGLLDLCSISFMDERDGVTARFAVIRRERLLAG